jgi:hypothetical protein
VAPPAGRACAIFHVRADRGHPSLAVGAGPPRLATNDRLLPLGTVLVQARLQTIEESRTISHHGE